MPHHTSIPFPLLCPFFWKFLWPVCMVDPFDIVSYPLGIGKSWGLFFSSHSTEFCGHFLEKSTPQSPLVVVRMETLKCSVDLVNFSRNSFCLVRVLLPPQRLCGSHNELWRPECSPKELWRPECRNWTLIILII